MADWVQRLKKKDQRIIARLITRIENGDPGKEEILETIYPLTGRAYLLGITGPPGAGKSSLLDRLIGHLRNQGWTVGVIAIDPTSPFSGGAILGDRVRMTQHALDEGVFIRSMGSRGNLGGLSRAAKDAAKVLDAAGYDVVLLETVGVGQAELDIMHVTDSVSLVLNPTAGDVVQVFKAGIMEIADLYVINKADMPGANRLAKEIAEMIDLCHARQDWRPPIVQTVATKEQGVAEWWEHLKRHHAFLKQGNRLKEKRRKQAELEIRGLLEEELRRKMEETWARPDWQRELELVERREKSPHQVAREWLKRMGLAEGGR